jgi:NAD(P)H-hydrate epimerase
MERHLPGIATRKQMQELDRISMSEFGIAGLVLMENAGRSVAEEALSMLSEMDRPPAPTVAIGQAAVKSASVLQGVRQRIVCVICGKGNNGGDGFVAARYLLNHGVHVRVFLLAPISDVAARGDAGVNLGVALKMGMQVEEVIYGPFENVIMELKRCDLIVDAIFGTGLTGAVSGIHAAMMQRMNESGARILAIDVPSGLDCNTGEPLGLAVRAGKTVTFGASKIGFAKPGASKYIGQLVVADIGIPSEAYRRVLGSRQ